MTLSCKINRAERDLMTYFADDKDINLSAVINYVFNEHWLINNLKMRCLKLLMIMNVIMKMIKHAADISLIFITLSLWSFATQLFFLNQIILYSVRKTKIFSAFIFSIYRFILHSFALYFFAEIIEIITRIICISRESRDKKGKSERREKDL